MAPEVPTLTCFDDLFDAEGVEVHMSDTPQPDPIEPRRLQVHETVLALLEEQADDVIVLQVDKEFRDYADYVILSSGRSQRHIRAQGERVVKEVSPDPRRACATRALRALRWRLGNLRPG